MLLLHHRLAAWQDHSAHCHYAVYATLYISTTTPHFQLAQLDSPDLLLLQLEPTQTPLKAELSIHIHHHVKPVLSLTSSDPLCWKQVAAQVPAPLGSCLSSLAPVQTGFSILQLSEVNIPDNTTVCAYTFEIKRRTLDSGQFTSTLQLLMAILILSFSIFCHYSHLMSPKGLTHQKIFRALFTQYSQLAEQI